MNLLFEYACYIRHRSVVRIPLQRALVPFLEGLKHAHWVAHRDTQGPFGVVVLDVPEEDKEKLEGKMKLFLESFRLQYKGMRGIGPLPFQQ